MSNVVVEQIKQRAIAAGKTIVIPEAQDDRVLQAAQEAARLRYARVQVVGSPPEIAARAKTLGLDLSNVEVVDHSQGQLRDRCVQHIFERRKAKGMTLDQAADLLKSPIYFGGAMVGVGVADGMVAGSVSPTADTVRSALYAVGCTVGNKTVSSCSVMNSIIPEFGVDGSVIFADTGVVPEPTTEQLADIAIAAAEACRQLLNVEPFVAMMSFSTKGSAYSPAVQKVIDATAIAQKRRPDLKIDGELQVDAAMMPDIASRKAKGSLVAGRANTLVFPDLSCGNIAYKLVERFGKAEALGPLLLGLAKPINDLSRGCSVEDIVLITAITALQAG
ncbi:MAG: phosphate acetyltransferase [Planctomycetaceae bacterium]|nr:phosphate acetyltransferase [Planctomycetaceae bacterium]